MSEMSGCVVKSLTSAFDVDAAKPLTPKNMSASQPCEVRE